MKSNLKINELNDEIKSYVLKIHEMNIVRLKMENLRLKKENQRLKMKLVKIENKFHSLI